MPPKKGKKEEEEERVVLGRISGHLKIGLVGLPNVGKSSTFNLMTKMGVTAANYPFATVDPSTSRCFVNDERFEWLCEHYKPGSRVPAYLEVTDIAGLVRGAADGAGLGNAFLSHIHAVDGIFHLIRAFDDADVTHVEDSVDPVRDLEIIEGELLAKDLDAAKKHHDKIEQLVKRGIDKTKKNELETMVKVVAALEAGKQIRHLEWKASEVDHLRPLGLLTAKPVVFLVNLSKKDYLRKKNKWLVKIKQYLDEHAPGEKMIIYSACLEEEIQDMDDDEKARFLKDNGTKSQMDNIIGTGFKTLNLQYFFTGGADEVKAWTIWTGCKAPDAAGTIHTDMQKGFIKADVMSFDDLKELGSDAAVREAGKLRQEGKGYVVQDGDIMHFKFNPPSSGKKK